jgi:hypothetical protein
MPEFRTEKIGQMERKVVVVEQSTWTDWKDLSDWGWSEGDLVPQIMEAPWTDKTDLTFMNGGVGYIGMDIGDFIKEHGYDVNPFAEPWHLRILDHDKDPYTAPDTGKEMHIC